MEEEPKVEGGTVSMLVDAFTFPLRRRWGWWLAVSVCVGLDLVLLRLGFVSARLLFAFLFIAGLVVRFYFSVIETTLTGYGEESWQGNGFNVEDLWSSIWTVALVALVSWSPAVITYYVLRSHQQPAEPWFSLVGMVGCEYFSMGVLGTVVFGSFSGAMPHRVLPAIFRSGSLYGFAAVALMLVPWSFEWVMPYLKVYEFWGVALAGAVASYFLITQARLVGLIYLSLKEKIGWD